MAEDSLMRPFPYKPARLMDRQAIWAGGVTEGDIALAEKITARPILDLPSGVGVNISGENAEIIIDGVIAKGLRGGGFVATADIAEGFYVISKSAAKRVLMTIDVPGGQLMPLPNLTEWVAMLRKDREVVALVSGSALGAGYWLAAAAEKVYLTSPICRVGGLGVVTFHVDVSQAEAKAGIKTTEISAGKYKTIASSYAPLSKEGRSELQAHCDDYFTTMCSECAALRGLHPADLMKLQGQALRGDAAIAAHLVDGYWSDRT